MAPKGRGRGQRPARSPGGVPEAPPPPNYDDETPKFCLHHICPGFDVHAVNANQQAAFAKTLQKLASSTWKDLLRAPRHGQGFEYIRTAQIRASVPRRFEGESRFMMFRYHGRLPMGGTRIRDVYHVLWIEGAFGDLYDHG
jgi:hypothetical protein